MHGELIVHVIDCTTFIVLTIYCDSANGSIWLTMPVACTTRGGGGGGRQVFGESRRYGTQVQTCSFYATIH